MDEHNADKTASAKISFEIPKKSKSAYQKKAEEAAKKQQIQDEETIKAMNEVISSLDGPGGGIIPKTMTFISGGSFNPGASQLSSEALLSSEVGKIIEYKFPVSENPGSVSSHTVSDLKHSISSIDSSKPKQIDSLLEEFKKNQEEREKKKFSNHTSIDNMHNSSNNRMQATQRNNSTSNQNMSNSSTTHSMASLESINLSKVNDSLSTNIRIGNITNAVTPELLSTEFSCYGPILSSKVMVPRSDSEFEYAAAIRKPTCGFVLFARREDAERAKRERDGSLFHGTVISLDWAKAPDPASMARLMKNFSNSTHSPTTKAAQEFINESKKRKRDKFNQNDSSSQNTNYSIYDNYKNISNPNDILKLLNPEVKKYIEQLTNKNDHPQSLQLRLEDFIFVIPPPLEIRFGIDTFAEHVFHAGDKIEKLALQNESNNPLFRFLFEPQSIGGIYYRWRIYSLRYRGESLFSWNEMPFKMTENGRFWVPPTRAIQSPPKENQINNIISSFDYIPSHISEQGEILSDEDRITFEELLRTLTLSRQNIRKAMIFAMDHAECAPEITQVLTESLTIDATKLHIKLARLFLVSDVLHNAKLVSRLREARKLNEIVRENVGSKAFLFNAAFYSTLPKIMKSCGIKLKSLPGRITAQSFKEHINQVLTSWRKSDIFMQSYIDSLQKNFLEPETEHKEEIIPLVTIQPPNNKNEKPEKLEQNKNVEKDSGDGVPIVDGVPIDDIDGIPIDDIDGIPIDDIDGIPIDDIDGVPIDDIDGIPIDDIDGVPIDDIDGVPIDNESSLETNPKKRSRLSESEVTPDAKRHLSHSHN